MTGPPSEITGLDESPSRKQKRKNSQLLAKSEDEVQSADKEGAGSTSEDEEDGEGAELGEASANEGPEGGARLMEEEEKAEGVVKLSVYRAYWRAVGVCLAPTVLLSLFLMQGKPHTHTHKHIASQILVHCLY